MKSLLPLIFLLAALRSGEASPDSGQWVLVGSSGPKRIPLIELFSSEGCSSCPPAEKRMAELQNAKGLWTEFVPLSFHVDYWDALGWKDALASPLFTLRQRTYAQEWNSPTVYTPAFVVDGKEYRGATES